MKQLLAVLLVFAFLFTNSCSHSRIKLVRKHRHQSTEQVSEKQDNHSQQQVRSEDVEIVDPIETLEETDEKTSIEERTIEQLDLILDDQSSEAFHAIIDKSKLQKHLKSEPYKETSKQESKERDSAILLVFGIVLLLGGVALIFYAIKTIENSDGSVDGCFTALLTGTLFAALGILIGIVGLVLIIIGMVAYFKK